MCDDLLNSDAADHRLGDRPAAPLTEDQNDAFLEDQKSSPLLSGSQEQTFFGVFVRPR